MPRIVIKNMGDKTVEALDMNRTILQHFHDNRIDWMQSCGGKGRCTTCKAIFLQGQEHCSELTAAEQRYIQLKALGTNERLCCQVKINGDIEIKTPERYKLPHLHYTD